MKKFSLLAFIPIIVLASKRPYNEEHAEPSEEGAGNVANRPARPSLGSNVNTAFRPWKDNAMQVRVFNIPDMDAASHPASPALEASVVSSSSDKASKCPKKESKSKCKKEKEDWPLTLSSKLDTESLGKLGSQQLGSIIEHGPENSVLVRLVSTKRLICNTIIVRKAFGNPNLTIVFPKDPINQHIYWKVIGSAHGKVKFEVIVKKFLKLACGVDYTLEGEDEADFDMVVEGKKLDNLKSLLRRLEEESLLAFSSNAISANLIDVLLSNPKINTITAIPYAALYGYDGTSQSIYFSPLSFANLIDSHAQVFTTPAKTNHSKAGQPVGRLFELFMPKEILALIFLHLIKVDPIGFHQLPLISWGFRRMAAIPLISPQISVRPLQRYTSIVKGAHSDVIVCDIVSKQGIYSQIPESVRYEYLANYLAFPESSLNLSSDVYITSPAATALFKHRTSFPYDIIACMSPESLRSMFARSHLMVRNFDIHRAILQRLFKDERLWKDFEVQLLELFKNGVRLRCFKLPAKLRQELSTAVDCFPPRLRQLIAAEQVDGLF